MQLWDQGEASKRTLSRRISVTDMLLSWQCMHGPSMCEYVSGRLSAITVIQASASNLPGSVLAERGIIDFTASRTAS